MTTDLTNLTPRDKEILVVLDSELLPYDYAGAFAQALKLGASPQLLRDIASDYLDRDPSDNFRMIGLPYIDVLLANGWAWSQVRLFVTTMFATEKGSSHQEAFMNDTDAWHLCQTVEQLMEIFRMLSPRLVLRPEVRMQIAAFMATLRNDAPQNDRDIKTLEDQLFTQLDYIQSDHQLTIALRAAAKLSQREQLKFTAQLPPNGFNLVYAGYMMARYPSADYELSLARRKIIAWLDDCPWQGADLLRWLIMGFQLQSPEYWELKLKDDDIVRQFERKGWHIVPVRGMPTGELRATVPNPGPRITVAHQPGGELVKPGSKVIVSTAQLNELTPQHTPAGTLYKLPLVPATVPTKEQLSQPGTVFYTDPHGEAGLRKVTKQPTR